MTSTLVRLSRLPGRLVGQDHARAVDQRPGDGDALLLPARQLVRAVVARSASPTASSAAIARSLRSWRGASVEHRQHTLPRASVRGSRLNPWKMKPIFRFLRSARSLLHRGDLGAVQPVGPAGRPIQTADHVHEGRLARA